MVRRGSTVRVRQRACHKDLHIACVCSQVRQPLSTDGHKTDTCASSATSETVGFAPLCPVERRVCSGGVAASAEGGVKDISEDGGQLVEAPRHQGTFVMDG